MSDKKYNGWTNYETWNVKLWMDQEGNQYWEELSQKVWNESKPDEYSTREQAATRTLADRLKDHHEEVIDESIPERLKASFVMDLLSASIGEVNWHEIAEHLLDEVDKSEDEASEESEGKDSED